MSDPTKPTCLNCDAREADMPLMRWHYQDRELWICANCLPLIIHKRGQLLVKWPPPNSDAPPHK